MLDNKLSILYNADKIYTFSVSLEHTHKCQICIYLYVIAAVGYTSTVQTVTDCEKMIRTEPTLKSMYLLGKMETVLMNKTEKSIWKRIVEAIYQQQSEMPR
uniref:Uncharacterized protein n=1 Tax=Cacopsylla melanoneura TaxID=428564 RepID=A0A8D8TGJ3_9HEMI